MLRGGYHIVDFKNVKFTESEQTHVIEGVYNSIKGSYGKPLVLTGININSIEYNDAFISVRISESKYVIDSLSGYTITIDNKDSVNVVKVANLGLSDEELTDEELQVVE
jgi:hypothetical protein